MAGSAAGILGSLRIVVDADTSRAQATLRKLGGIGGVVGGAIGTGLGIAGVAALKIGDEYNDALKAIRIGTGATGDQLEMLEADFKAVAGRVPQDLATVGQAVADVNTRTGQTGAGLQALSQSFLDMGRLLDGDVSSGIASVTRLYGDWSVATEDQIATNDLLLRAAQATGVTIDGLAQQMVQFGAPLRNLGFSLDEAAAMLSKWEKEGVNTTLALGGLKIALGTFAKAGKPAKESTEALFEAIKNTTDAAEAMAMGVKYFGTRAGPDMVAAIREGRFEFADFADELASGTETVQGLSDDTRTFGDTIRVAMNKVKVAIGPVTDGLAGIADAMGNAIFLLPAMAGALGNALGRLWTKAAASRVGVAAAAAAGKLAGIAYAAAAAVVGKLTTVLVGLWGTMGGGRIAAAAAAAGSKAGLAFAGAAGAGGIIGSIAAAVAVMSPILIPVGLKLTGDMLENATKGTIGGTEDFFGMTDTLKMGRDLDKLDAKRIALAKELAATPMFTKQYDELKVRYVEAVDQADELRVAYERAMGAAGGSVIGLGKRIEDANASVKKSTVAVLDTSKGLWQALGGEDVSITPPDIAGPIRSEFQLATAAVAAGFGSIKQALANPPQMISKDDRLANMAKRMKKVMANIKKATEVGDPMAQRYWEKARAKQQQQIDKLKGKTTASLSQVKSAYQSAGVKVGNVWDTAKNKTKTAAKQAADGAISEAERIGTTMNNMDLTSAGTNLMNTWAGGIRAGTPAAVAAATEAAAAVAAVTVGESPPPKGPLSKIDQGGRNVMEAWLSGFDPKRAASVGARLGAALAPRPALGALAMAGSGGGALMGGSALTIQVGTLIADDKGIDTLVRRIEQRTGMRSRKRQRDFAGLRVRD